MPSKTPKPLPPGLFHDADHPGAGPRCTWCQATPAYRHYHDTEWGFPVDDDRRLFEKLCLEGFQAGLSWLTILNKRENFRKAFANFDAQKVARFGEKDIERLLQDAGIVRHRGKIVSTINNANRALELRKEFGSIAAFAWSFEQDANKDRPEKFTWDNVRAMTQSPASVALSKALKKRGWTFVGPTTMYAFMQAMGMVNDHFDGCASREKALAARKRFKSPNVGAKES
ncbi:MAG: DNA-3-methyladenine glycosylase I [Burkholderiaceae bacterium]|nr:DNA-3-methyladenine glycosylase I [Burkholderiaceae bacterium]